MVFLDADDDELLDGDEQLSGPFYAFADSGTSNVIDSKGRVLTLGFRATEFVKELASVMNENRERLELAWKKSIGGRNGR